MPHCSVPGCQIEGGHKFPKDPTLKRRWVVAIKRDEAGRRKGRLWKPGTKARVCRAHFTASDYRNFTSDGYKAINKKLKDGAVPSVFSCWHQKPPTSSQESSTRAKLRESRESTQVKRKSEQLETEQERTCPSMLDVGAEEEVELIPTASSKEEVHLEDHQQVNTRDIGVQIACKEKFSALSLSAAGMLHYYTGLETYAKFRAVFNSLGPAVTCLVYYYEMRPLLSLEDQLLVTLIKLRRHTPHLELAFMFNITVKQVTNIFITWINFMNCQWDELNFWPDRELVRYYTPSDFKAKYPKTRVILDGAECPIQKPGSAIAQQTTFSTYKNRNTVKTVVGGTPGGLCSYVSPAYGGSASDRQIIERSNMVKMCDPGDQVMADKGFNVDDIFIPYQIELNIPSFFKKKNRLSCKTISKDRKIASKRVHIERLIGLGKTYNILTEPMNPVESSLATPIIRIIFTLCNFRTCIVPTHA